MWPVWRIRQVRYGPQHRATRRTMSTVTRAARFSSLYNKTALAWLILDFMELCKVEKLVRSCWPVDRMEGDRDREHFCGEGERTFFPYMDVTELRRTDDMEFLRVRTEFPLAAVNILTYVTVMMRNGTK